MINFCRWLLSLAWIIIIWQLTTIPDFHPSTNTMLSWLLSNGGHFTFFGILAVLIPLSAKLAIIFASLYGLLIELVQLGIHGRSFSLFDWALDTLGAITFLFLLHKLQSKS